MYGRFDCKARFVKLVGVDIMVDSCCVGTINSSAVDRVNSFVKGVSLVNEFSYYTIVMDHKSWRVVGGE